MYKPRNWYCPFN